jgi:hypothetical protein
VSPEGLRSWVKQDRVDRGEGGPGELTRQPLSDHLRQAAAAPADAGPKVADLLALLTTPGTSAPTDGAGRAGAGFARSARG